MLNNKKLIKLLGVLVLILIIVIASFILTTRSGKTNEKTVTIAWVQEPATMNRAYSNMWYQTVLTDLYSCWPWNYDVANEPHPNMLTEMPTVSEDGLVVTMTLRDDLSWSDGTPLTSEDFVFTYEMIMSTDNIPDALYPYDQLASVTAPDPLTVVMTFDEVFVPWMSTFWQGTIMPKHILQPVFEADGSIDEAEWNMAPTVGCGPFNFTEWESGSYMRFDKNPNFWGTPAKLDAIVFQFITDEQANATACIAGDADICNWPPYDRIPDFRDAGFDIVTEPSGYNEGWFFNIREMASPGIKDLNVRKAIAMGLDRQGNTDLRLNVVKVTETYWDALPGYEDPSIIPYIYDPEAAKALLESSGYVDSDGDGIREDKDGNPLTITQGNTDKTERMNYQALAQQQMKEIGIDLQIFSYISDVLFAGFSENGPAAIGELDIMQWSDLPSFPDPDTSYWRCDQIPTAESPYGSNYFVCDETLDELFQLQSVTTDPVERQQIFWQISKYMYENVIYLGIWEDGDVWAVNPKITGYKFSGVTPFFNVSEWDITQ